MKKAVFFVLLVILVITMSQFMAEAEVTYSYKTDISSMIESKGCPNCHSWMGEYSDITSKRIRALDTYWDLVAPGEPDSSVIMWKISGKNLNGDDVFGSRMPEGGSYFTDDEIAVFRAWITQGALYEALPTGVVDTKSWMEIKSKFQ
ncbi:hypothetical protein ACFL6P_05220 [Candidatus Latescibacterota bacterium]